MDNLLNISKTKDQKFVIRHLIPENLNYAKQSLGQQLKALRSQASDIYFKSRDFSESKSETKVVFLTRSAIKGYFLGVDPKNH